MTAQITQALTAPDPADGIDEFSAAATAFCDALPVWAGQANAVATEVNTNATAAATAKTDAEAAAASAVAASALVATTWTSGNDYAKNAMVWGDDTAAAQLYRCIAPVTNSTTAPGSDTTHFAPVLVTRTELTALQTAVDEQLDVRSESETVATVLALDHRGKGLYTSAQVTVPANATVAFPVGAAVPVSNSSGSAISITAAAGVTLRLAGTATTGTRTLAGYGQATLRKMETDTWFVSGAGLT